MVIMVQTMVAVLLSVWVHGFEPLVPEKFMRKHDKYNHCGDVICSLKFANRISRMDTKLTFDFDSFFFSIL